MACIVMLMIEEEQPEGLSSRKLVVETAKHNVLTSYNAEEGLDLLRRFPNVDAVMIHHAMLDRSPNLIAEVRAQARRTPIILATPYRHRVSDEVQYVVDSHRPHELLKVLAEIAPPRNDPEI